MMQVNSPTHRRNITDMYAESFTSIPGTYIPACGDTPECHDGTCTCEEA